MLDDKTKMRRWELGTAGNVMIMGVMAITLLSVFGVTLVSRMIVDSNAAAKRINASQAFYLADAGIQLTRRYLKNGFTADTTWNNIPLGAGTYTVVFNDTTVYWMGNGGGDTLRVYQTISTGTVGCATRRIIELRKRVTEVGFNDKQFITWREDVQNEF